MKLPSERWRQLAERLEGSRDDLMGAGLFVLSLAAFFAWSGEGYLAPFIPVLGAGAWAVVKGGRKGLIASWPLLLALLGGGLSLSLFRLGLGAAFLSSLEGASPESQDALGGLLLVSLAGTLLANNLTGWALLFWLGKEKGWRRWVAHLGLLLAPFFLAVLLAYLAPFFRPPPRE